MQTPGNVSPKVALFVPCYVDQLYPDVGFASLEVLERLGLRVEVPREQTCCGQPLINLGDVQAARPAALRLCELFSDFDYVVCPSGSCVAMVRHYAALQSLHIPKLPFEIYELCEFLVDVMDVQRLEGSFPYRVAVQQSCHGLRELRLAASSELVGPKPQGKPERLLKMLDGISLLEVERADECCGFGGTFCVTQADISALMGSDRLERFEREKAEIVTATDMSCLMHLSGLMQRQGGHLSIMHIAQVLAGRQPVTAP